MISPAEARMSGCRNREANNHEHYLKIWYPTGEVNRNMLRKFYSATIDQVSDLPIMVAPVTMSLLQIFVHPRDAVSIERCCLKRVP